MQELLKIMTCGSVDDGKSTLIGHLMYNARVLLLDQTQTLKQESNKLYGEEIDYSLLLDGLEAEREQRITIDVAYRFFSTEKRSFIIADTPGHNEYTRNMAVGASFADLAVILIDVSKGILPQTQRHYRICKLMGIRDFVFVLNKMDLVSYNQDKYEKVKAELIKMTADTNLSSCYVLPVSATVGDNITAGSERMNWFDGVPLLEYLETIRVRKAPEEGFVLPVQRISRMPDGTRGCQGSVESGSIRLGDAVTVYPSGEKTEVQQILNTNQTADSAAFGNQVTLVLKDNIDVSRGCVICKDTVPAVSTQFRATLLWLDEEPLVTGKSYFLKIGTMQMPAAVTSVEFGLRVEDNTHYKTDTLQRNDLFSCVITASSPVVIDAFSRHKILGELILIDRVTHATAACGTVTRPLDDRYIYPNLSQITRADRAQHKHQKPATLWLTGLPGAGKSTIANEVEKRLFALGKHTMLLDGDNIRAGINRSLGFSPEDRAENIRITAEIAKLMNDAGLIVLVALVSPRSSDRERAKKIIGDSFFEVFVSAQQSACAARDKKGYYQKAREGKIQQFTGVSAPYESPSSPDLMIDTEANNVSACAGQILQFLYKKGII